MLEEETEVKAEDNLKDTEGQVEENQGQSKPEETQPTHKDEYEVEPGKRVSLEELKSGFMKDADYRRKTAEVAEDRRRLQAERESLYSRQGAMYGQQKETEEEVNPIEVLANEVIRLKSAYARDYLNGQIDKLAAKYPEADRRSVFAACWSNPNAIIEDEMVQSHDSIIQRVSKAKPPATLEEFFKTNPKAKEDYDRKVQEDFMRKKAMKPKGASTGSGGSAASAETVKEKEERPKSYSEVSARLKDRLKEEGDESF